MSLAVHHQAPTFSSDRGTDRERGLHVWTKRLDSGDAFWWEDDHLYAVSDRKRVPSLLQELGHSVCVGMDPCQLLPTCTATIRGSDFQTSGCTSRAILFLQQRDFFALIATGLWTAVWYDAAIPAACG